MFNVVLIKRVQQRVTSTVSSSAGTSSLGRVIRALGLTAERTLVDATLLGTRERQTHMLKFKHCFRANRTHVLDSVLVTDIIRTFDGIVHVPAPIIVRISGGDGAGDATLRRHSVRASRKHFSYNGGLVTTLG